MPYNGNRIDLSHMRAKDMVHNKDIMMPGPPEISDEIKIQTIMMVVCSSHRSRVNTGSVN